MCKRAPSLRLPSGIVTVGVTGGIASGQSTVARTLRRLGASRRPASAGAVHLVEADSIARELTARSRAGWRRVVKAFGRGVLAPGGELDRGRLAEMIFEKPAARRKLESILHPLIIERERRTLRRWAREGKRGLFVVGAALMIEAGTHARYDVVVVVYAPQAVRLRRLRERDGLRRSEALARVRAQMPLREKRRYADFVVDNSRGLGATRRQVLRLYGSLTRRAEEFSKSK
jgi:dephospho-CoA kinase